MNDLSSILSVVLELFVMIICGLIAYVFNGIAYDLKQMSNSVQELNLKIAEILYGMRTHEMKLEDHNERLSKLENGGS